MHGGIFLIEKYFSIVFNNKNQSNNIWEAIFPTLIMGDDRAIVSTWVNGNEVKV